MPSILLILIVENPEAHRSVSEREAPMASDEPRFPSILSPVENVLSRRSSGSSTNQLKRRAYAALMDLKLRYNWLLSVQQQQTPDIYPMQQRAPHAEKNGQRTQSQYDSSLLKAMLHTTYKRMLFAILLAVCGSILTTTSSLVTKRLVKHVSVSHEWAKAQDPDHMGLKRPASVGVGFALAIGLGMMKAVSSICDSHSFFQSMTTGTSNLAAVSETYQGKLLLQDSF